MKWAENDVTEAAILAVKTFYRARAVEEDTEYGKAKSYRPWLRIDSGQRLLSTALARPNGPLDQLGSARASSSQHNLIILLAPH